MGNLSTCHDATRRFFCKDNFDRFLIIPRARYFSSRDKYIYLFTEGRRRGIRHDERKGNYMRTLFISNNVSRFIHFRFEKNRDINKLRLNPFVRSMFLD